MFLSVIFSLILLFIFLLWKFIATSSYSLILWRGGGGWEAGFWTGSKDEHSKNKCYKFQPKANSFHSCSLSFVCLTVFGPFLNLLMFKARQNFKRTFSLTHLMVLIRNHFDSSRIQARTYPFLHCLFIFFLSILYFYPCTFLQETYLLKVVWFLDKKRFNLF